MTDQPIACGTTACPNEGKVCVCPPDPAQAVLEVLRECQQEAARAVENGTTDAAGIAADISRRLAAVYDPEDVDEGHPEHISCALGCRLDMDHGGACRERRGSEPICSADEHVDDELPDEPWPLTPASLGYLTPADAAALLEQQRPTPTDWARPSP